MYVKFVQVADAFIWKPGLSFESIPEFSEPSLNSPPLCGRPFFLKPTSSERVTLLNKETNKKGNYFSFSTKVLDNKCSLWKIKP